MICTKLGLPGLLLVAALLPAHAQNARTWISGAGIDQAGCGTIASPCRTLQYAHNATVPGGEIDVKDAAGYGSVTITKAISIINDGVGTAGVLATAGNNAITVNASASDGVTLRGLTIEGSGAGNNGVELKAGAGLTMANCVVQGFTSNGVSLKNGTSVLTNSTFANNGGSGISLYANYYTDLTIDNVLSNQNGSNGIAILSDFSSPITARITRSVITNNPNNSGIYLQGTSGLASVIVETSTIANNRYGIATFSAGSEMFVGRSTITGNEYGYYKAGGNIYSYRDNHIVRNSNSLGTLSTATAQ